MAQAADQSPASGTATPLLQLEHVSKQFGGVKAIDDVRLTAWTVNELQNARPDRQKALASFLDTLNRYTIADILDKSNHRKLASAFATFTGWAPSSAAP